MGVEDLILRLMIEEDNKLLKKKSKLLLDSHHEKHGWTSDEAL